jgi:hypothetical protein
MVDIELHAIIEEVTGMQRSAIQNSICEYAEEEPESPETDLSEEGNLWLELMVMIDEGNERGK